MTASKVQRLMYEELKKIGDIRIDLLNTTFNRPTETALGRDFIKRTDQTLSGKWYRFRMWIKRNVPAMSAGGGIMGMFYLAYDFIKTLASGVRTVAVYGYRGGRYAIQKGYSLVPSLSTTSNIVNTGATIAAAGLSAASSVLTTTADTAKFVANNIMSVFIAIITIISILYSSATSRK